MPLLAASLKVLKFLDKNLDFRTAQGRGYLYNKVTGEVRKMSRTFPSIKGQPSRDVGKNYIVMKKID